MAVYNVKNADAMLSAVEFAPVSDGNLAFFTAKDAKHTEALKQFLTHDITQTIVGESQIGEQPVIITRGAKPQEEIIKALETRGTKLELAHHSKSLDTWKLISMLAVPGQLLQLSSSLMRKNHKVDWGMFVFAASNLVGHAITWNYGAQKSEDTNRLLFVKEKVNKDLSGYVAAGDGLPSANDSRKELYMDNTPQTSKQKVNGFLEKNSVYVGEIMCRYLGAFSLAFPANQWPGATKKPSLGEAYKAARNPSELVHFAGMASLAGKTTSLFAKTTDDYNQKPNSAFESFREKIAFKAGGWIEAGAFGTLTYDALSNPNRRIMFQGKEYRDYVGALGSALFTARYIVRHWAKFGEKSVDMDEVYAHTTDCLAKMPTNKLPMLLASTAGELANHFKDQNLQYGEIYTRLSTDLYRYHHIAVDAPAARPSRKTPANANISYVAALQSAPETLMRKGA